MELEFKYPPNWKVKGLNNEHAQVYAPEILNKEGEENSCISIIDFPYTLGSYLQEVTSKNKAEILETPKKISIGNEEAITFQLTTMVGPYEFKSQYYLLENKQNHKILMTFSPR